MSEVESYNDAVLRILRQHVGAIPKKPLFGMEGILAENAFIDRMRSEGLISASIGGVKDSVQGGVNTRIISAASVIDILHNGWELLSQDVSKAEQETRSLSDIALEARVKEGSANRIRYDAAIKELAKREEARKVEVQAEKEKHERTAARRHEQSLAVPRMANRIAICSMVASVCLSGWAGYLAYEDSQLRSDVSALEFRVRELEQRASQQISIGSPSKAPSPLPAIQMPNVGGGILGSPAYTIPQTSATPAPIVPRP